MSGNYAASRSTRSELFEATPAFCLCASERLFALIGEVQDNAADWMWICNHEYPNMVLGGVIPKQKLALVISSISDRC